jgi:formimidoylglutamate deiminase
VRPTTFLKPDWLYWDGELRDDVALGVGPDGLVTGVQPAEEVPQAARLSGRALLPGMVNGHSHAFQRLIRGRTEYVSSGHPQDDFWSWRELMYQAACALDPEGVYVASRQAFLEMALSGITSVGEFHYLHHQPDGTPYDDREELAHQVIRAARDVGLRICLLRVGYARSGYQLPPNPRQRRFLDKTVDGLLGSVETLKGGYAADPFVTVGLAPHSVRAVPREWLEALRGRPERVHMHVAEQPAEVAACRSEYQRTPVQLIEEAGLLGENFTAVHAIHLDDVDVMRLGRARALVCACPSTERNLGDGVVPADALLNAGARVCLGSDSQATINLLDEARQLESHLRLMRLRRAVLDPGSGTPDGLAKRLFQMATVEGARSLGLSTGALKAGAPADYFTVDLNHPTLVGASRGTLLPTLVFGGGMAAIREVVVNGKSLVSEGHHLLLSRSREDFSELARRLFS